MLALAYVYEPKHHDTLGRAPAKHFRSPRHEDPV